ncbi:phosphate ABC transporter permease subunit PstC [Porticoccaceae bacterium LTM1]|nr:phosphate ABC transporter permease subunit PstC [Porticoccaceae bacterium LTM1]
MQTANLLFLLLIMAAVAYYMGRGRSYAIARPMGGIRYLNSLPFYYGTQTAIWCAVPSLILMGVWLMFDAPIIEHVVLTGLPEALQPHTTADHNLMLSRINNIASGALSSAGEVPEIIAAAERLSKLRNTASWVMTGAVLSLAILGGFWGWAKVSAQFKARNQVEKVFSASLMFCAMIAIFTTVGIVFSVLFETIHFISFDDVELLDFLFGSTWSPQSGKYGALPLFVGTLLISFIAMLVAVPVGLMSAIYLAEYAHPKLRSFIKPTLEILAGIPTVVYGFFAALTVAPFIRGLGESMGLNVASESALAAGVVMGVMIIPFVSSLSDDVIRAVPQAMRDGSLGLGATKSETIKRVIFPAALPGIVGGILLAVSRAIGETMIVVMAAGLAANMTANPLEAVTTVTVQIVLALVGDQEFNSPQTLVAFALGLVLFVITLGLNMFAQRTVKKYREQYD